MPRVGSLIPVTVKCLGVHLADQAQLYDDRALIHHIFTEYVVPKERLELSRCCHRGILNPLRLPFRHLGTGSVIKQMFRPGPEGKRA